MKKVLLGLLLLCSVSLFAQYGSDEKPFHFGVGTAISLPLADLKTSAVYGIGLELQPSYLLTENLEAFLQAGVHVFGGKGTYGDERASVLHIPVLVGGRFKVSGFFAGAGIGYGDWIYNGGTSGGFMYSPQIGYGSDRIEIGANYSVTKVTGASLSYVGLKLFRKF